MDAYFPGSLPSPRSTGSHPPCRRHGAAELLTVRSLCSHNDLTVLVAVGEVDRSSIAVLRRTLYSSTGWTLLEASKVTFCDVAGARLLVSVARFSRQGGHGVVVAGGSRQLLRVLRMVDPTGVVHVRASLAGALGAVDRGPGRRPGRSERHRTALGGGPTEPGRWPRR